MSDWFAGLMFYVFGAALVGGAAWFFVQIRRRPQSEVFRVFAGIICGLALGYLFMFAPLFLPIQSEWTLATLPLGVLATPFVIWFCIYKFRKL